MEAETSLCEALEAGVKSVEAQPAEDFIAQMFARGGYLNGHFPGYEMRAGQVELAYLVEGCQAGRRNGLAEAPTGTGKSVAYCVPAIARAAKERTVVVTANIALQEQLAQKDLPFLKMLLQKVNAPQKDFKFALAKGLGNYLCPLSMEKATDAAALGLNLGDEDEREQWATVTQWAGQTKTGDISELPFEMLSQVRQRCTTSSDDCLGKECKHFKECPAMAAKRTYQDADIVVTNYHLFFADIAVKSSGEEWVGGPLPLYKHVVLDEGHRASDIARDFFGFKVSYYSVRWVARLLAQKRKGEASHDEEELRRRAMDFAGDYFDTLGALYRSPRYKRRLRRAGEVSSEKLRLVLQEVAAVYGRKAAFGALEHTVRAEYSKAAQRIGTLMGQLKAGDELAGNGKCVYFLEEAGERVALRMKPIDVSEDLERTIFANPEIHSAVVVSATLQTGGKSAFKHVKADLGVKDADELTTASPFNFAKNAAIIIPKGVCLPDAENRKQFHLDVARVAVETAMRSGGRMLGLFTSYESMMVVRDVLRAKVPYTVLAQRDAPRTQLIQRFKDEESSILLGTESFWQGVDVPGPALSVVLIDKLPFPSPDDPILDVVSSRDDNWFMSYSVPRAIIAFRQGLGRLIRSTTDRGVVVLCDRRVETKGYGKLFLRAVPTMHVAKELDYVQQFFGTGAK